MSENYLIRNCEKADAESIAGLFAEIFGKTMTREHWLWKYSVPGNGKIYSKVAMDSKGSIIAYAGAIPLKGLFNNRATRFFQIADVMVHPEARGYFGRKNVFGSLMKALFEDISREFSEVFCYGFPGKRPYRLGERAGVYEKIEIAMEGTYRSRKPHLSLYSIKPIEWNDYRLESLWEKTAGNLHLSLVRDRNYLQWRYASNPLFTYKMLGLFLFGKLKGWLIMREEKEKVYVTDLLVKKENIRQALKALYGYCSKQKKSTLHIWLPKSWRNGMRGFQQHETEVVVTNMVWKLPVKTSLAKESLYYTMGDTDIY
jgi:hypothetical protein